MLGSQHSIRCNLLSSSIQYFYEANDDRQRYTSFRRCIQWTQQNRPLHIEKGADVNHKTSSVAYAEYDGLSPLYGAVSYNWMSQNHQEPRVEPDTGAIVRSLLEFGADVVSGSIRPSDGHLIWMKSMCGIDATVALINYGLDLKQRDSLSYGGGTILHYWASLPSSYTQEESLSIVKLLLSKDADLLHVQDKGGFSPIIRAANSTNLAVLEYLLERADVTRVEKIEALELAGAVILTNFAGDEELRQKAFDCWRRALHSRQIETKESDPIVKIPLARLSGGKVEWVTTTQLEELIQQSSQYAIQSLLVRLRIFSGKSWAAIEPLFNRYFQDIFEAIEHLENRYDLILDILWAMLDSIRLFDRHQKGLWKWTVTVAHRLFCTLSTLEREHHGLWNHETAKTSLQLILATDQFHLDDRGSLFDVNRYAITIPFQVVKTLIAFPEMQSHKTMQWLFQVVHRNKPEKFGTHLLHMACKANSHQFDAIRLLLDAGADPNAIDGDGNAPLHVVARLRQELMDPAVRLMLKSGAHLDRVNNSGKTAADIWIECNEIEDDQDEDDEARWNARPDWCRATRSLSCLSARVIRSNEVTYSDGDLPATLNSFLGMH